MGYFGKVKDKIMKDVHSLQEHKAKYDKYKKKKDEKSLEKLKRQEKMLKVQVSVAKKKKELSKYSSVAGFGGGKPMFQGTISMPKSNSYSIGEKKQKQWRIGR